MQKRDLWYGYRWTVSDTWTFEGLLLPMGRLWAAYGARMHSELGLCIAVTCPRALGKEAVQSPRAMSPVQPAVRGVEMPGRAANR